MNENFIKVYKFHNAPKELKDLSNNGGDEDWIAVVPKQIYEDCLGSIEWLESDSPFGCCCVEKHTLKNGNKVFIGCHS